MEVYPQHQCLPQSLCESFPDFLVQADLSMMESLDPLRNPLFLKWINWITNGVPGISLMIVAVILFWRLSSNRSLQSRQVFLNWPLVIFALFAMGISDTSSGLLKHFFGRIKPLVDILTESPRLSFPSSHAFNSAFCMALAWGLFKEDLENPRLFLVLGLLFAGFVSFSRVLVMEHFPSDVVTGLFLGWLWGSAWAFVGLRYPGQRIDSAPHESL